MTLVILGIAVATLARIATHSLDLAQRARGAAVDLQQKWAESSARHRLLEEADRVFGDVVAAREAEGQGWPHPALIEGEFTLGGVGYRFVVADEQAKVNLNELQPRRPDLATGVLLSASREHGLFPPLRIRPLAAQASNASAQSFTNWGHLLDLALLSTRPRRADTLLAAASSSTCWGDGRLNITRASDAALLTLAQLDLGSADAHALLEARNGFAGELDNLLDSVELPRAKLGRLRRRLTDRSSCYALWLVEQAKSGDDLILTIQGDASTGAARSQTLRWP